MPRRHVQRIVDDTDSFWSCGFLNVVKEKRGSSHLIKSRRLRYSGHTRDVRCLGKSLPES